MHGLKILLAAAAAAVVMSHGGGAKADEIAGSFGLGFDHAQGGADGMSVKYVATPDVQIQAIIGVNLFNPAGDPNDKTTLDIGILGAYRLAGDDSVGLMVGGGIDIGRVSTDNDSTTTVALEVTLGPEWFVMPNVSLSARAGFILDISGESENFPGEGMGISIGVPVDLVGSFGFHYYFF